MILDTFSEDLIANRPITTRILSQGWDGRGDRVYFISSETPRPCGRTRRDSIGFSTEAERAAYLRSI